MAGLLHTDRFMKADEFKLLERCVEEGLPFAWRRAFKHHPDPPELTDDHKRMFEKAAVTEVMNSICEWFNFDPIDED